MFLCRLCKHWVLWWGWPVHAEERISGAVCHPQKSWWFTEWLAMISERSAVHRTKRTGPSTEPWGAPYMAGMVTKTSYWLKWTDIYLRDMTETFGAQQTECQKQNSGGRREFGGHSCRKIRQKKKSRAERILFTIQYLQRCLVVRWLMPREKMLLSRRILCTPYNHAPCHITSCKATYAWRMRG